MQAKAGTPMRRENQEDLDLLQSLAGLNHHHVVFVVHVVKPRSVQRGQSKWNGQTEGKEKCIGATVDVVGVLAN